MKWKPAFLTLILLTTVTLTGCWDRTEMNDLALVMASGYDLTDDGKIQATLQIALPSTPGKGQGDKQEPFLVESMTGDTIHDALVKIQERMSRQIYEGHRRVIVVGEEFARHGVRDLLDQFSRDPESRFRSYIVVAKDMTARELLAKQYPFERVPAEAIRELEKSKVGYESTIRDYLIEIANEGIEPIMGVIELITNSTPDPSDPKKKETIHLAGTAVFQDLKLIGYLNDRDTRAMLWVKGERPRGIFTAKIPDAGYVSVEMRDHKSRLLPNVENGKAKIRVEIDARAAIHENSTMLDLSRPEHLQRVEQAMESSIKKRVVNVLTKSQKEFHLDIFGIGREMHRHQPKQWASVKADWNSLFSEADLDVDVSLKLVQLGMSRAPLHTSGEEGTNAK